MSGKIIIDLKNILLYRSVSRAVYYIDPDTKIAYLEIAKAATTSIKAALFNVGEEEDYNIIHQKTGHQKDLRVILPRIEHFTAYKYKEHFKFTFVRNPLDRLVSCYKNKYHTDKKYVGTSMERLYFDPYLFGYMKEDRGFKEFVRKISKIPLALADPHFVPQSFIIFDKKGKKRVDYIGKFEDLENDWSVIKERFNLTPLPHYNKTNKGNWMNYYDREAAELAYKYYEKDIKSFGYEDSYRDLLDYIEKKRDAQEV